MTSKIKELLARKAAEKAALITPSAKVDDLLDTDLSILLDESGIDTSLSFLDTDISEDIEVVELAEGEIDPRLKLLSHSSRCTLHKCPRKYQLYRLSATKIKMDDRREAEQAVTFAYGKVVGMGMQSTLEGKTEDQVYLDCFLEWDTDLLESNPKQNKSFWLAMFATKKFLALRQRGFLEDYELVYYNGKPAVELSFQVDLPNDYRYRGFVDGVLKHKATGEIMVLEAKTTSGTANSTDYKNSGQALGYSVVLDILFPEMSSYSVLYLVYEAKSYEFVEMPFKKSLLQRALWLQELLIDTKLIDTYAEFDTYPMHGESCNDFFRDCEYLGVCTLGTARQTKPLTTKILADIAKNDTEYQFRVSFEELVQAQISKGELEI